MTETFATVLNCIDGRVQVPAVLFLLDRFGVDHVDTVTEAGMIRFFSDETDTAQTDSSLSSVHISLEKHGSRQIAIVAHDDCVGNPIPAAMQQSQVRAAVYFLRARFPQCEVIGLWVDADWIVHELDCA